MSEDIKEILDKAKEISDYGADGKQHTRMFNQFEAKALLDYITNLKEELKSANESITWRQNRFNAIQEENKKLKKWDINKDTRNSRQRLANKKQLKLIHDYKSRCAKAIDKLSFIDETLENDTINVPLCISKINKTINILQGSEKSEK